MAPKRTIQKEVEPSVKSNAALSLRTQHVESKGDEQS